MKRESTQEELINRWTLAPNELVLLMNKTCPPRLEFAARLKFFQAEGRLPGTESDVPAGAVEEVVKQRSVLLYRRLRSHLPIRNSE